MAKKHDRQQRYQDSLEAKGLKNIRIIIPARREDYLREWAAEERDELKREQMVEKGDEP